MAGGLVNIVSYGTQDIYLSGTPQISFFKIVYRRHTNFSVESIELPFDDEVGFDIESNITIPTIADLINKIYIKIDLPKIYFPRILTTENLEIAKGEFQLAYNNANDTYQIVLNFMTYNADKHIVAAYDVYIAENITTATSDMINGNI